MRGMRKSKLYRVGSALLAALMVLTCVPQMQLYAASEEPEISEGNNEGDSVPATSVAISSGDLSLVKGETRTLTANVYPDNSTDKVSWSSSNPNAATIHATTGLVVAVGDGTTTITAKAGNYTATCTVTVTVPVEKVTVTPATLSLMMGDTSGKKLTATIEPSDASSKTITWSSENENIAKVETDGTVTPVSAGTCKIFATASNRMTGECQVTVSNKPVYVTNINYSGSNPIELKVGETFIFSDANVSVEPAGANNKKLTYQSDKPEVASVNDNGVVTGVGVSTDNATITITALGSDPDPTKSPITKTVGVKVVATPVEKVELRFNNGNTATTHKMTEQDEVTLTAIVTPTGATNRDVTWSSSNSAVASFTAEGNTATVTAVKAGNATITATSADGTKKAECAITVEKLITHVTGITLDRTSYMLPEGKDFELKATVTPEDADDKDVTWSSSNTSVATVDEDGKVTAVGMDGDVCVITAETKDGGYTATCRVTLTEGDNPVQSITLNAEKLFLQKNSTFQLVATVEPAEANQSVRWTTSKNTVANVADGLVKALGEGECVITAQAGKKTVDCVVKVTGSSFEVTPGELSYAATTPADKEKIKEDLTVTFYQIVDGVMEPVNVKDDSNCIFTLCEKDPVLEEYVAVDDNRWSDALATPGEYKLEISYKAPDTNEVFKKTVTVTVTEFPPAKLSWIAAIPKEWNVINGTPFNRLPLQERVQIEVRNEDGTTARKMADIQWTGIVSGSYSTSVTDREQTFTAGGTVILPENVVDNGVSLLVTQEVNVREAYTGGMVSRIVPTIKSGSTVARNTILGLTCETEGAVIHYTTNGTKATRMSSTYAGYITLIKDTIVISAVASKPGWQDSIVETFYYKVDGTLSLDNIDAGDIEPDDVTDEDRPTNGRVPDGLWIAIQKEEGEADGFAYTGAAIKPEVHVYDHTRRLTLNKDYTISYKNNINVGDAKASAKPPTITVAGKGNYEGKADATFTIKPQSIKDEAVLMDEYVAVAYNKKAQKPAPALSWNGKKLTKNKDYSFPDVSYSEPGKYSVTVTGMGNYTGQRTMTYEISDVGVLVTKLTFSKIANQEYTGSRITPEVTVKNKNVELVKDSNYTVTYVNNINVGTASVIITGLGGYKGSKRIDFKITPVANISKAGITLTFDPTVPVYTGGPIKPTYTVAYQSKTGVLPMKEGKDYKVTYQNNDKVGTASIIFTGMGAYTGTVKKTFKIQAYDITQLSATMAGSYSYEKNGCKPKPEIVFGGTTLKEGTDYTLSYKNNNKIGNTASVTIKGKGNFKGTITKTFTVTMQDISKCTVVATDKPYQNRANIYRTTVKVLDPNGVALTAGSDYDKSFLYTYANGTKQGEQVMSTDIIPPGTMIRVEVRVTDPRNYQGKVYGTYRIVQADIAKAKVTVDTQEYTGFKIKPRKSEIHATMNGVPLGDNDFEIVGYDNNVNQGTAKVTIRGINNYGGTKTVNFKIKKKGILSLIF